MKGEFLENQRHGKGILHRVDGTIETGVWDHGIFFN